MKPPINVFVLTFCRRLDLFYGTELIFKTLRVGFPSARITIVDNASLPDARAAIAGLARATGCAFRPSADPGLPHHEFIDRTLTEVAAADGGTLVFLDPDLCLWSSCEDFEVSGLMAGKLIEAYDDDVMRCVAMPRLHTSFLWIPDARKLAEEIQRIKAAHFDFRPFLSFSVKLGDAWIRYDTGAALYAAISDRVSPFTADHMDRYDHIFCGSHFDLLQPRMTGPLRDMMGRIHEHARKGNLEPLKGIWRQQGKVWMQSYQPARWRAALARPDGQSPLP